MSADGQQPRPERFVPPTLPWDITQARDVLAQASRVQAAHQEKIREAYREHARRKHLHRVVVGTGLTIAVSGRDGSTRLLSARERLWWVALVVGWALVPVGLPVVVLLLVTLGLFVARVRLTLPR